MTSTEQDMKKAPSSLSWGLCALNLMSASVRADSSRHRIDWAAAKTCVRQARARSRNMDATYTLRAGE